MRAPSGADLLRLAGVLAALVALAALMSLAFAGAGRSSHQAVAAGTGVVGLGLAAAALVMLVMARRGPGRITNASAMGTLGLATVFLVVALVV